jgi:hypothetical protein
MSGECNQTSILGISFGTAILTSQADITNTITSTFSSVCRIMILVLEPLRTAQKCVLSSVTEAYNFPFSMDELLAALEHSSNTSPGPSSIHNLMLSHLPAAVREFLLSMYNCIWMDSSVPAAWREAVVVSVLNPGMIAPFQLVKVHQPY